MFPRRFLTVILFIMAAVVGAAAKDPMVRPPSAEALEFFEKKVRPIFAENCFSCHGEKKQQAGLRLDSKATLLKGSEHGPVVTPGEPEKSPLIQAIRYEGDIKMPPKKKLPAEAVATLTQWVKIGAPWPEEKAKAGPLSAAEARKRHWAFQPVRMPPLPLVKNPSWCKSPIDQFVLAALEAKGLSPTPAADRRTLIRRATFDLTGLPPTAEEVDAFVNDQSPDAFEKLIDQLLASPRYGERWGRYWLDVARYGDTRGYVYAGEERRYPFSYTYRDYVIRAFNEDLPYDRFLLEQLAADQLNDQQRTTEIIPFSHVPNKSQRNGMNSVLPQRQALAAMGFLLLGRRHVNNMHDVIDDRLDVIFRGTQALTVSCARCHDHKFDPIPTKDYYSLYGVLAGCTEKTVRLVDNPEPTPAYLAYAAELDKRQQVANDAMDDECAKLSNRLRQQVTNYLIAVRDAEHLPGDDFYVILSQDDVNPVIVRRWYSYLLQTKQGIHPIFGPWHAFAALPEKEFAAKAAALARQFAANADRRLNPRVAGIFAGSPPTSMKEVAERYGKLLAETHQAWQKLHWPLAQKRAASLRPFSGDWLSPIAASLDRLARKDLLVELPKALPDPDQEALRQVLYSPGSPTTIPRLRISEIEFHFDDRTRVQLTVLQSKVDQWNTDSAAAPPHALVLEDKPLQTNPHVLVRGNPSRKGEEVPRRFLELLAGDKRTPFLHGSGRLELAKAIASRDNPLTARVMVNRIWLHHFGAGLIRTPSDFGSRSEPPTHPDLLDYLARRFMDEGWSIKKLHRLIMLASVYQQGSQDNPTARRVDPENRLLWKMNRQRLDFEAMRDSLLAVSGRLDLKMGGRPVELTKPPFSTRRTVYGYIDRQFLPGVFRVFDFANPDVHSPQRYTTTVPQQALFLMNSPFIMEQAKAIVGRSDVAALTNPAERIDRMHRVLFQRRATAREIEQGMAFVSSAEPATEGQLSPWEQYVQVLLLSNEFVFVD